MVDEAAPNTWTEVVDALAGGRVEGADRGPFARHETHGSVVLVSGSIAYKVKKPVRFEIFDYRTIEARREMCELEVALNQRLAPDLYLGSHAVVATDDGFRLEEEGDQHAVEWVVAMRPVAKQEMLSYLIDSRQATVEEMGLVGRYLAAFHLSADRVDPELASPERLRKQTEKRVQRLRDSDGGVLEEAQLESVLRVSKAALEHHRELLSTRAKDGWVRDGHGDLRLEHVALRDGSVAVIDCVEFDPELRSSDVLEDLAFLVMELELAGRDGLGLALTDAWAGAGGPLDAHLLCLFGALKALVRVEVATQRLTQLDAGYQRDVVEDLAKSHLRLGQQLAWRALGPTVVVIGGLSGSGKTAISQALASNWGVDRVASDETRKELVGVGRDELAPEHAYEDRISGLVYENLGRQAAETLSAGRSLVVDATFRRKADQVRFFEALRSDFQGQVEPRLAVFELCAHDDVLRTRVKDRGDRGGSDANVDVLEEQLAERGEEGGLDGAFQIQTAAPVESLLSEIETAVLTSLG